MMQCVYVDCVEFYSEKLIATYVSHCIDNVLKQVARDHGLDKVNTRLKKKLTFKQCRNFPALLDGL